MTSRTAIAPSVASISGRRLPPFKCTRQSQISYQFSIFLEEHPVLGVKDELESADCLSDEVSFLDLGTLILFMTFLSEIRLVVIPRCQLINRSTTQAQVPVVLRGLVPAPGLEVGSCSC